MSEWISKYWYSVVGAGIAIAVAAYRLSQTDAEPRSSNPRIWRGSSLSVSLALAALPVAFFVASNQQALQAAVVLQAVGLTLISLLFFLASPFADRIALFAVLCWLSTSSVRPTRVLWTSMFGFVFLGCAVARLVSSIST